MERYIGLIPKDWPNIEEEQFKLLGEKKKANFCRASDELVRLYNSPLRLAAILRTVLKYLNQKELFELCYMRSDWEE